VCERRERQDSGATGNDLLKVGHEDEGEMGKSKNKGGGPNRANPLSSNGASSHRGASKVETDEEALEQINIELGTGTQEKKEVACHKLAMICDKLSEKILSLKMVRMVAPLIVAPTDGVQLSALGALKNLSMVSEDVCEEMVSQDVLTPLNKLVQTYAGDWRSVGGSNLGLREEVLVEAVSLLSNLCEASSSALEVFNQSNLMESVLLKHIDATVHGYYVVTSIMQCIYSVTENNPSAVTAVLAREAEMTSLLTSAADVTTTPSQLYVKVLVCGIVLNTVNSSENSNQAVVLGHVMATVAKVLEQDQRKMATEFAEAVVLAAGKKGGDGNKNGPTQNGDVEVDMVEYDDTKDLEDKKSKKSEDEARIKDAEDVLRDAILGQQTALEILTNLCCCDQEDEDNEEQNMDSDSDDMDAIQDENFSADYSPLTFPPEITEVVASSGILQSVLAKANLPEDKVMTVLASASKPSHKLLTSLRVRSFLCLNNLVTALPIQSMGGPEALFGVWSNLGILCFKPTSSGNDAAVSRSEEDLLESATSAMRACTQKLQESKSSSLFSTLDTSDFQRMVNFASASPHSNVRINMVQVIGSIGVGAAGVGAVAVTDFLLEAASKDTDLRVVAESLDKIFDMFAEDDTDQLAVETRLVPRLKGLVNGFKIKLGIEKKKQQGTTKDFDLVVGMAKSNLTRFIKYKEKRPIVAAALNK